MFSVFGVDLTDLVREVKKKKNIMSFVTDAAPLPVPNKSALSTSTAAAAAVQHV